MGMLGQKEDMGSWHVIYHPLLSVSSVLTSLISLNSPAPDYQQT